MTRRIFTSHCPEHTREAGRLLGKALDGPAVIALTGPLGAGKTCFAQGLALGLGVSKSTPVTSPTYTLVNQYYGRMLFCHADFYRLPMGADLESLGLEPCFEGVLAVEWAQRAAADDLQADLAVCLSVESNTQRRVIIKACGQRHVDLLRSLDPDLLHKEKT